MKKPHEEELNFTLSVDEMLQLNSVMLSNFASDQQDYIAIAPDLNNSFFNDWKKDTENFSLIESDDDFIDTQLLMTQAIDELMAIGSDQLQTVYFYVDRAYPDNKAVLSYFGKDRYEAARNIPQKLIDLILKCVEVLAKDDYKNALIAKGFNKNIIDEINKTALKLKEKFSERDVHTSGRKLVTQNRNKLLNKIWASMSAVNKASKLVYKTNYAKQQQYLLYYPKTKTDGAADDNINTDKTI